MKYLYIKLIIGGIVNIINVTNDYIFIYEETNLSRYEIPVVIKRKEFKKFVARKNKNCFTQLEYSIEYTRGWKRQGFEPVITKKSLLADSYFGEYLELAISNELAAHEYLKCHLRRYISVDNPLVVKYFFVENHLDWRILNSNHFEMRNEFPFLIRGEILSDDKEAIYYEVVLFEEKTFTDQEWKEKKKIIENIKICN